MKKHRVLKIVLLCVGGLLITTLALFGGFIIFASATTLQVKDAADVKIDGQSSKAINASKEIKLVTWNVGYGALDEKQDCYWDGGKGVTGESKEVVQSNISAMNDKIQEIDPDIFFIQEADINSRRSFYINELEYFQENCAKDKYNNTYACNFKAGCVPLPLYNMTGKVEAGITSFSKYQVSAAQRVQLPIPFSWPVSLFNLKRCLLINRTPIAGTAKELVTINLHLEAYDDGEGKAKQLKQLMDLMEEEYQKGNYVIAGGDFNQTFSNANIDFKKYPQVNEWVCPVIDISQYPNFTFSMDDTLPTCRSLYKVYANHTEKEFQYYMLDGFITSNNITVNNVETLNLNFKNTDHNPVKMSITLK